MTFLEVFTITIVQPFLLPDVKAAMFGLVGFFAMIFLSSLVTSVEDIELYDFAVPVMTAIYLYLHNYNRAEARPADTALKNQQPASPSSSTPTHSSTWMNVEQLLENTKPFRESGSAPLLDGEIVCVFILTRDSSAKFHAFHSIASRHTSTRTISEASSTTAAALKNKVSFLAVSPASPTSCGEMLRTFNSGSNLLEVEVRGGAGKFVDAFAPSGTTGTSPMVVALRLEKEPGSESQMAQLVWRGHVAVLERFLNEMCDDDGDSTSGSDSSTEDGDQVG